MRRAKLLATCGLFLAVDFALWALSWGKLYAIQRGHTPDGFAAAEGCLACCALFFGFDIAGQLSGWWRIAFVGLCGAVPVLARQLV